MTDRNPSSERKADATESMKTETATQAGNENNGISQNPKWLCPECESDHIVRVGLYLECRDCGNEWERDDGGNNSKADTEER